ncbi:MAG: hypothetical protein HWN69_09600 [Desulfobacterales bacterium]|nr:hypothetical protein [Desulfobacterales bacterium]
MRTGYTKGQLEGDWAVFAKIAGFFVNQVPAEDREDFLQDLLVEMAKVKAKYEAKGKTLTEPGLMRVAKYELLRYLDKRRYRLFGLNCTHCTVAQRRECHTMRLPSECPKGKARRLLSLDKPRENNDGDKLPELIELISCNKSIDLDARLDARNILKVLPKRLVRIGYKIYAGVPLEAKEKEYLKRWQKLCPERFEFSQDHMGERILEQLRKNPRGMTRSNLANGLKVYVRELNLEINRLIKDQQVIAVRRETTRGRAKASLLFIAGAPIPEVRMVEKERDERIRQAYYEKGWSPRQIELEFHHSRKTVRRAIGLKIKVRVGKKERDERIRQAYFTEGWSIKRINRELHHDKRTIRRAIYGIKIERSDGVEQEREGTLEGRKEV